MNEDRSFVAYCQALESRHLRELTFVEVRRGLQALSQLYVHKRDRLGRALDGAGKRAAFAWFYGAMHFLVARDIAHKLGGATWKVSELLDLGCGTGAASAAVASVLCASPPIVGTDVSPWALAEARFTWSFFGLMARAVRGDIVRAAKGPRDALFLLAYVVNELAYDTRRALMRTLFAKRGEGGRVLIIEPIAIQPLPWWSEWREATLEAGGREDEWLIDLPLPPRLALLDKAAGLHHQSVKARSLFLGP